MVIDINTYVGHWPFRQVNNSSAKELVKLLDENKIDVAAVSSINAIFYKDTMEGNTELFEQIKPYKDRFLPFCIINPNYIGWKKDFITCVEKYGAKGLELYPCYHNYNLSDPNAVELMNLAAEKGLPVLLPCAVENIRQKHWMDTDKNLDIDDVKKVLGLCPNTDFIISNGDSHTIAAELKEAADNRKGRLYYDFARIDVFLPGYQTRVFAKELDVLIQYAGIDRVVLGSVLPFQYADPQFVKIEYSGLSESDKEKILSGNLKELFKL